jgi:DNA-binding transcriptional regulator YiaG
MRIKKYRIKFGLTQSAFAAELGVTLSAVQHWEYGKRKPPKMAFILCELLVKGVK